MTEAQEGILNLSNNEMAIIRLFNNAGGKGTGMKIFRNEADFYWRS